MSLKENPESLLLVMTPGVFEADGGAVARLRRCCAFFV